MSRSDTGPFVPYDGSPSVVALGGGHGLAASLQALRRVTTRPTAIVTVADDGGSSGRLRGEFGVLPPGDLRMALAALCGDDEWGRTWSEVVQHRFRSDGDLHDHSLGNLLIVALWELLDDSVTGLDWVARLLGAQGRVLPMSLVPLDIEALVEGPDEQLERVRGQVAVATATGRVRSVSLLPGNPPACPRGGAGGAGRRPGRARARDPGSPASCRTCWCRTSRRPCRPPRPGGPWSST